MSKIARYFVALFLLLNLSSCYTTRQTIGDGPVGKQKGLAIQSKAKNFYLIGGIFPLNSVSADVPLDKNCQIETRFSFWDIFLSSITVGVVTSRTTRVKVAK